MNDNRTGSPPRLLLVEDDPTNRDMMWRFLKRDFDVDFVGEGSKAISMAAETPYRVVIMDIILGPGMNGLETTREIRKLPGYERTPIIAVTAYHMEGNRETAFEAGCSEYLPKPFTKSRFLSVALGALDEAPN